MTDRDLSELPCRDLVELVTEYLEDRLSAVDRARFDAHLAECEACRAFLEQFRQTIRTLGGSQRVLLESVDGRAVANDESR